jgi:hypothetical protein
MAVHHDPPRRVRAGFRGGIPCGNAGGKPAGDRVDHAGPPALIALLMAEISRTQSRRSRCSRVMMASGVQWK